MGNIGEGRGGEGSPPGRLQVWAEEDTGRELQVGLVARVVHKLDGASFVIEN